MKNLKKALVLVLTFAMIFGMFTIGASAASFSDDEDIVNKEAVETMVQLGIINGYEDGTFLPKQVVTRAEMCKMICVALNSGTAPLLDAGVTVFSDTVGHWASAYINYCYAKGIVSGDSGKGGPFRPDAAVTALEAAKMMLVALGYNAQIAGFTGADWAQNVAKEANRKGLFDGIGALNANAGLTRDNAAQLIFNGINADLVDYDNTLVTVDGQLTTVPKIKDLTGKTIITESYKAIRVEGVVVNNEFVDKNSKGKTKITLVTEEGINQFSYTSTTSDGSTVTVYDVEFKVSTGADVLGKRIVLYVKPSTAAPKASAQATVIGAPAISTINNVFSTNEAIDAEDIAKILSDNGLKLVNDSNVTVYKNGRRTDSQVTVDAGNVNSYDEDLLNDVGVETQYIDNNGDGVVDVIVKLIYGFGLVEEVSTSGDGKLKIETKGLLDDDSDDGSDGDSDDDLDLGFKQTVTIDKAKTDVVDFTNLGLKKGDYVKYYEVAGKYYVEKVSGVTVNVTAMKGDTVTASGKTYEKSALAADTFNLKDAVTIGESAVFYLDNAGAVIYATTVTSAETPSKYLMVVASNTTGVFDEKAVAKVVLDDGTVATVNVSKVTHPSDEAGKPAITEEDAAKINDYLRKVKIGDESEGEESGGGENGAAIILSYTIDDDGNYELTAQDTRKKTPSGTGDEVITKNQPLINNEDNEEDQKIVADSTTLFVVEGTVASTYKIYKGYKGISAVPTVKGATVYAVVDDNDIAKVVFAVGGTFEASQSGDYIYILDATPTITKDAKKKDVYTYDVIRNGEVTTIVAASDEVIEVISDTGLFKAIFTDNKLKKIFSNDDRIKTGTVDTVKNGIIGIISDEDSDEADCYYLYDDATVVFIIKNGSATVSSVDDIKTGKSVSILLTDAQNSATAQYIFVVVD